MLYDFDPAEEKARDNKQRQHAEKILRKFFQERAGKPVTQKYAYNINVSQFGDKDHTVHWAFYEWIGKEIEAGRIKKKPRYRKVLEGYDLEYKED